MLGAGRIAKDAHTCAGEVVVLAAHGAQADCDPAGFASILAERLRQRRCFAAVEVAFLHGKPHLAEVLDRLDRHDLCVVPLFAGQGYHARVAIPAAIRASRAARLGCRIRLMAALGTHPAYIESLARRMRRLAGRRGVDTARGTLLAVGHGCPRTANTDDAADKLAAALRLDFAVSLPEYLRGDPPVRRWREVAQTVDTVVVPLLFGAGRHARVDIPLLFGLPEAPPPDGDAMSGPWPNAGRRLWYATLPPTGASDADAVVDLVQRGSLPGVPTDAEPHLGRAA